MSERILVATDGSPDAAGALRLARALEQERGLEIELVAALEPIPLYGILAADLNATTYWEGSEEAGDSMHARVKRQLSEMGMAGTGWPITVAIGMPAPIIARVASDRDASLVVMGLGRHGLVDRWMGTETTLRVMRIAHVPVLAVRTDAERLPRRILVAVDFSDFSRDAARAALRIAHPEAEVHLAHVVWSPSPDTPWDPGQDWIERQHAAARDYLDRFAGELSEHAAGPVETHMLEGKVAAQLLDLTERLDPDLVVSGTHGTGFLGRAILGSVATRLIRGAKRSVLVAPPREVPAEVANLPAVRERHDLVGTGETEG
jgi:nucleotide-binding universal stress UspA family protein